MTYISTKQFLDEARKAILNIYKEDQQELTPFTEVIQVWYCKTLRNHKGLFITNMPDTKYFECTYNGERGEMYVDEYKKCSNRAIPVKAKGV